MHDVFFGDGQVTKHTWILAVQSTYEFSGSPMKSRFTHGKLYFQLCKKEFGD